MSHMRGRPRKKNAARSRICPAKQKPALKSHILKAHIGDVTATYQTATPRKIISRQRRNTMPVGIGELERKRLRALAAKQAEYASLPLMAERAKLWLAHNDLKGDRPMINTETGSFEKDILPPLECETPAARELELSLLRNFLNHEKIGDDRVVSPYFDVPPVTGFKYFDITIESVHAKSAPENDAAQQYIHKIGNLQEDLPKLKPSSWFYDAEKTEENIARARDVFGDILTVRRAPVNPKFVLTRSVVYLMGMEQMCFNIIDCPDEFDELLRRMTGDYLEYCRFLERNNLLTLNNDICYVWPTTHGYTRRLPDGDFAGRIRMKDLWLGMDSQETVTVSPAMYGEIFFPYYKQMSEHFGRLMYGCCEPTDRVWEWVSRLHRLSKLSISPWCDVNVMGERLAGSDIIFHRKVSPNYVGIGKVFNEEGFTEHIRETLLAAKGCELEFALRDIYTLCGDRGRIRRAVEIIRNEIENIW